MALGIALLVGLALVAGGRDRPALIARGGDPAQGVLLNVTAGANPCDRPDPARPTVVFVHGTNLVPNSVHFTMAEHVAGSLARRGGPAFNVLKWDWNAATLTGINPRVNHEAAVAQGRSLAATLLAFGVVPGRAHLIGHSSGGIVAASAARSLHVEYGQPVAQLTFLDPARFYHDLIFNQLAAGSCAGVVENYWAAGASGYGGPAAVAGVRNARVDGPNPVLGLVNLRRSSHFFVVEWYLGTIENPSYPSGFNTSVLLRLLS